MLKMKYNYLLAGITIATDIEISELVTSPHMPEVELRYGNVPEHLDINQVDFPFVEANKRQYLLRLPNMGRYFIEDGNCITIEQEPGAETSAVIKYLLTAILAPLSYMRGFMPFHGGALLVNGKAVLVSGISSIGKSALLASLYTLGYTVLADDISNVKIVDGKVFLYPCFPRIMIWGDIVEKLKLDEGSLYKMRSDLERYLFPIDGSKFVKPVEVCALYILTAAIEDNIIDITGRLKVDELRGSLFQPWMAEVFGEQNASFKTALLLASLIKVNLFESIRGPDLRAKAVGFMETVLKNA
jgi:hypothetical protein